MSDLVAYHESGHALMALLLGGQVQRITIEPQDDDGPQREGDTQVVWRSDPMRTRHFAKKAVQVCLAGPVAEMIFTGDPYHPGLIAEWAEDWRQAWRSASSLYQDDRTRLAYLEKVTRELHHLLKRDDLWTALASLADHLVAHETLEAEQIEEIVGQWLR